MVTCSMIYSRWYRRSFLGLVVVLVLVGPGCESEDEPIREDAEVTRELPAQGGVESESQGSAPEPAPVEGTAEPADLPAEADRPLTTEYCPRQPHFTETSVCFPLHESEGRALVQHGDPAVGIFYMEDRMGDNSEYFEIPLHIKDLKPGGYTVQPIPGEYATYVFNGEATLCATYEGDLNLDEDDTSRQ